VACQESNIEAIEWYKVCHFDDSPLTVSGETDETGFAISPLAQSNREIFKEGFMTRHRRILGGESLR
jgi:hypothetical protein